MTALPPAGWYPDPEAGGTTWRWWDGVRWSPPAQRYGFGYGYLAPSVMAETHRNSTTRFAKWLRWAMVANLVSVLSISVVFAVLIRGSHFGFVNSDATGAPHFSGRFFALQLATVPLELVTFGYVGTLIAWIFHAGKFAESQGWPARRGPLLGALSVLIPIVQFWWPYEAVRDSFPPGSSPPYLISWWLGYLVGPFLGGACLLGIDIFGTTVEIVIATAIAACILAVPVVLGWKLIRDVASMQRANSPGRADASP